MISAYFGDNRHTILLCMSLCQSAQARGGGDRGGCTPVRSTIGVTDFTYLVILFMHE